MTMMAYLAVKKLSALLRGITSKHHGDFYCLNCFRSFETKNEFQLHKRLCENKDFCNIIMPSEGTNILEFNQHQKSDKAPFIMYVDLKYIIEKIDGCKNNSENSSTAKVSKHIPSGFSMSTICLFRTTKNKRDVYSSKDCMKKFLWILKGALSGLRYFLAVESSLKMIKNAFVSPQKLFLF